MSPILLWWQKIRWSSAYEVRSSQSFHVCSLLSHWAESISSRNEITLRMVDRLWYVEWGISLSDPFDSLPLVETISRVHDSPYHQTSLDLGTSSQWQSEAIEQTAFLSPTTSPQVKTNPSDLSRQTLLYAGWSLVRIFTSPSLLKCCFVSAALAVVWLNWLDPHCWTKHRSSFQSVARA